MADNKTDDYSRDADQTRYLYLIGIIAGFTLLGLFALEVVFMFTPVTEAKIFTPEIVHTLIPVTVGAVATIGGFLFGRGVGAKQTNGGQK